MTFFLLFSFSFKTYAKLFSSQKGLFDFCYGLFCRLGIVCFFEHIQSSVHFERKFSVRICPAVFVF